MSDLEKLNAEIERLEEQVADLDNRLSRYALDDWRMKERIKLLVEAGEGLMELALIMRHNNPEDIKRLRSALLKWQAAKDGKDAQ